MPVLARSIFAVWLGSGLALVGCAVESEDGALGLGAGTDASVDASAPPAPPVASEHGGGATRREGDGEWSAGAPDDREADGPAAQQVADLPPPDHPPAWGRVLVSSVRGAGGGGAVAIASFGASPDWLGLAEGLAPACHLVRSPGGLALDASAHADSEAPFGAAPALVPWLGPDWPLAPGQSLGALTLSGVGTSRALEPNLTALPQYAARLEPDLVAWLDGAADDVVVSAPGADGAGPLSLSAPWPSPPELTEPATGPTAIISLDAPLRVSWAEAGDADRVEVRVAGVGPQGERLGEEMVVCAFDHDPGTVEVPSTLLSQLPRSFGTDVSLSVTRAREVRVVFSESRSSVTLRVQHTTVSVAKAK